MTLRIETATTPAHFSAGKALFTAYAEFLGIDLEFQGFTHEMNTLPSMYGPPGGCLLLAKHGERYIGAVGLRRLDAETAEMKRLYVLPDVQGSGAGKARAEAFIGKAGELGYRRIRLDSVRSMDRALNLYRALGFIEIDAYRYNPFPDAVYMEKSLPVPRA